MKLFLPTSMLKYMVLEVCDFLDILLILSCLDPGQFDVWLILIMWYDFKNILFTSGSIFSIRLSGEKLKIFFNKFFYIVQVFCICLHKFDYIVAIVAWVSDVAHGHLCWGGFTLYFLMNIVSLKPPILYFSSCSFCIFAVSM